MVEKFLSKDQGKRFFQFFYSFGAAIVILGALAKLTHWPYGLGNIMLTVGLLTEFLVFLISAFDRPAKEYQWEQVFPVLDSNDESDRPLFGNGNGGNGNSVMVGGSASGSEGNSFSGNNAAVASGVSGGGSGPIIIGGGVFGGSGGGGSVSGNYEGGSPTGAGNVSGPVSSGEIKQTFGIPSGISLSEEDTKALSESIKKLSGAAEQISKMAELTDATQQYLEQLSSMSENMGKFSAVTNNLTDVSDILLNSYRSITDNSDGINQHSRGYVQQMESLNRNISGLNTIYEIQLKSVSSQIDAIERINAGLMRIKDLYEGSIVDSSVFRSETEKMAQQLGALNGVYNRLLNAMTMNMYGSGGSSFNPNPGGFAQQGGYNYPNPGTGNPGNYNQPYQPEQENK